MAHTSKQVAEFAGMMLAGRRTTEEQRRAVAASALRQVEWEASQRELRKTLAVLRADRSDLNLDVLEALLFPRRRKPRPER